MIEINKIHHGDCLEVMKSIDDNSIDAIVTDPPYGLSFMGKKWDYDVPSVEIWQECLRVLKPGGYLLSFAGTRTQHRMACRIEDAGFEIRDMIGWIYGSGFPKSLNISKAIDATILCGNSGTRKLRELEQRFGGKEYKLIGKNNGILGKIKEWDRKELEIQTDEAKQWFGWGTALKPALEPITVARKPLSENTVAQNCLKWGTGGINIDDCRITIQNEKTPTGSAKRIYKSNQYTEEKIYGDNKETSPLGRFPANIIHDGSDEVLELFPNTKSGARSSEHQIGYEDGEMFNHGIYGKYKAKSYDDAPADSGSASRFFYCAKASKSERNKGCGELEPKERINYHPTVKPIALMEYLVKLVSKEGAVVLDPFAGSGTTGLACINLKRNFILVEKEKQYIPIIEKRLEEAQKLKELELI